MDWKLLIAELQGFGLSQGAIAGECGCGQSTISELAKGVTKDPRHSIGEKLRQLAKTKREEAAAADAEQDSGAPATGDRRDPLRVNAFPDLDRRAPATAAAGEG